MTWQLWAVGHEQGVLGPGTHVFTQGTSLNTSSPIAGAADADYHYNRDGNDDVLCAIQHRELYDAAGLGWRSAAFRTAFTMPSSVSGTSWLNITQDKQDFAGGVTGGNYLQFRTGGELRVLRVGLGGASATFTATLTGGTTYILVGKLLRVGSGRHLTVRLYDSGGSLTEEQTVEALIGDTAIWCWGMLDKSFTGTDPNAHAFMDDQLLYYTNDDEEPFWIPPLQQLQVVTVATGTPQYDAFTGSPDNDAGDKYTNVDELPNDGDTSYNQSSATVDGAAQRQTHKTAAGPTLSGSDVINGVMAGVWARILGGHIALPHPYDLTLRDDSADDDLPVGNLLSANYTNGFRHHGLLLRPGGGAWTETARDALEVGAQVEIDTDSARTEPVQVVLPTGDGSVDGQWTEATGTPDGNAYTRVDDDISLGSNATYLESSTAGHDQALTFPTPTITGLAITGLTIRARFLNPDALFGSKTISCRCYYRDPDGVEWYSDAVGSTGPGTLIAARFFATDPYDGALWTAARVGGADGREFGIEYISGTIEARCTAVNVELNLRSQWRESAWMITTVYGEEIELAAELPERSYPRGVGRGVMRGVA